MNAPPASQRVLQARRHRGQAGLTLVEILVAIAIGAIVLGPVGSWMILSITSQAPTAGRFNDASQARLLETYVTRDVASSEIAFASGDLPPGGLVDCGSGGEPILNLYELGSEPRVIVYGTDSSTDGQSLWRWTCGPADRSSGPVEESLEVLRGLEVDGAGVPVAAGSCDANPCALVGVTATLQSGVDLSVEAARRSSAAALASSGVGLAPQAAIGEPQITPRTTSSDYQVSLSASDSWDLDDPSGSGLSFEWTTGGTTATGESVTFQWSAAGDYSVGLVVTDTDGNTSSTSTTVTLENRPPQIDSVQVTTDDGSIRGVAGLTQFTFSAFGADTDTSAPVTYQWRFPDGRELTGQTVNGETFPTEGAQTVLLTVTDAEAAPLAESTSQPVTVQIGEPADPGDSFTLLSPSPNQSFDPPLLVGGPSPLPVTFTSTNPDELTGWELRASDGTVLASRTVPPDDPALTYTFPACSRGEFTIEQRYGDPETVIQDTFQVEWPLSAAFQFPGPTGPGAVQFEDLSSPAGCVNAHSWNLGFPGWDSTAPEPSQAYTNPGLYVVSLTVSDATGRTDNATAELRIPGAPSQPGPPGWSGDEVVWAPIEGAEQYRVVTTHTDDEGCNSQGITTLRDPIGPFTAPAGTNTCPGPGKATAATLAVLANGEWSPPSVGASKP